MEEIWKDMCGILSQYEISNYWRVKSKYMMRYNFQTKKQEKVPWVVRKLNLDNNWYSMFNLDIDSTSKRYRLHRLVWKYFIPNPDNKPCINHKDWNKSNNCVDNLERCTYKENMDHARDILWIDRWKEARKRTWAKNWKSKPINMYDLDWKYIRSFESITLAAKFVSWYSVNICRTCMWRFKQAYWYKREYKKQ